MLKEVSDFQENLKKYKEKAKADREVYEKLLFKSDKLVNFLYNGVITLSKTIGKVLHNLLLKIPFDMKEVTGKLVSEDVSKLHEWVLGFEKNEFAKKAKIFRNIADKVHFYKKLELPLLQDAYNRIFDFLKNSEALAERGEYSMLNTTSANLQNTSLTHRSQSKILQSSRLIEADEYNINILDELNNPEGNKREGLTELLVKFSDKLASESITDLPPVLLEDFIKKFKMTVDQFHSRVLSISLEPKNNFDEEEKPKEPLCPDELTLKNHAFHVDCLEELQSKLRYLETRFSYIKLILDAREIPLTDLESIKTRELLQKNRELNEDDFSMNYDDKANTDIIKMLEESFLQKEKILKAKRQFIEHLTNIKEDMLARLNKVFEGLNAAEDQYMVMERAIVNLQSAIQINQQETKSFVDKTSFIRAQKESFEKELARLREQIGEHTEVEAKMREEVSNLETRSTEKSAELKTKTDTLAQLQKDLLKQKLTFYEVSEKVLYIEELREKFSAEGATLRKKASEQQTLLDQKLAALKSIVAEKKAEESQLKELEAKLRFIEEGASLQASCACAIQPETKAKIEATLGFFSDARESTQKYEAYVKLIEDFLSSNDVNFNQFLKLTVTSTMNLNDKIAKIHSNLKDRNLKLIEHIAEVLEKSYHETCFAIVSSYLKSSQKTPLQNLELFEKLRRDVDLERKRDEKTDPMKLLKNSLKVYLNVEELCRS